MWSRQLLRRSFSWTQGWWGDDIATSSLFYCMPYWRNCSKVVGKEETQYRCIIMMVVIIVTTFFLVVPRLLFLLAGEGHFRGNIFLIFSLLSVPICLGTGRAQCKGRNIVGIFQEACSWHSVSNIKFLWASNDQLLVRWDFHIFFCVFFCISIP